MQVKPGVRRAVAMNRLFLAYRRALRRGDGPALAQLIRANSHLHAVQHRFGLLVSDISRRAPDLLEAALEAGLHPDAGQGPDVMQTFLQAAAAEGDAKAVTLALRYGAQVDKRNHTNEHALGYACAYGHLEVAKLLVAAGADVNAVELDPEDGVPFTALDACSGPGGHSEVATFLRSVGGKRSHEISAGV